MKSDTQHCRISAKDSPNSLQDRRRRSGILYISSLLKYNGQKLACYLMMNSEKNGNVACRRCGNCCHVDVAAYVTLEDIQRWEKEGRHDILAHVRDNDVTWSGDRISNRFGSNIKTCLMSCVYLQWYGPTASCQIYETRTKVCRSFVPGSSDLCPQYHRKLLGIENRNPETG